MTSTPTSGEHPYTPPAYQFVIVAGLRTGWLNALIIGATIVVWLSIIGGLIAGGTVGFIVARDWRNNESNVPNLTCPEGQHLGDNGYCVSD
jgi:hypothetical protein